jgi:hypothetical protein
LGDRPVIHAATARANRWRSASVGYLLGLGGEPNHSRFKLVNFSKARIKAEVSKPSCCRITTAIPSQTSSSADTRSAVQRFLVARFRDATAAARFFPPDDFGREPEDFLAPPLDALFPPDAADVLAVARDSFFAAVLDRIFVSVPRVFVLDADRLFTLDAPFREGAVALGLRADAAARRLDAASSPGSWGVSPLEPLSCRALATDGALGNVEESVGEVAAGTAWRLSNRSRTTLCARLCLLRAWRISSPCRSRPATL